MKIENQVVSLELSKELREAGYPRGEGAFYWVFQHSQDKQFENTWYLFYKGLLEPPEKTDERIRQGLYIVAPTVAELGERLPAYTASWNSTITKDKPIQWICDNDCIDNNRKIQVSANTEADARARLWIHLIKNGLWKEKR